MRHAWRQLVVMLAICGPGPHLIAQRTIVQKPCPPTVRGKYSLGEVIDGLTTPSIARDIQALVQKHGVDLQCTLTVKNFLRGLGANEAFLQELQCPRDPVQVVQPKATLVLTCKPVDCQVVVEDKYYGSSVNGVKTVPGLKTGDTEIEVFADGFERKTQRVTLAEGPALPVMIEMKAKPAPPPHQAQAAFLSAVNALGGFEGVEQIETLLANGNVTLKGKDLKAGTWGFSVESTKPVKSFTMTGDGGEACTASLAIDSGSANCNKKKKAVFKSETFTAAGMLETASIGRLLTEFANGEISVKPSEGGFVLESKGTIDTNTLTLDSSYLPLRATKQSNGSPDIIEQIEFSDYKEFKKLHYPSKITVSRTVGSPAEAEFKIGPPGQAATGHKK